MQLMVAKQRAMVADPRGEWLRRQMPMSNSGVNDAFINEQQSLRIMIDGQSRSMVHNNKTAGNLSKASHP